jgi:hypothetical protein
VRFHSLKTKGEKPISNGKVWANLEKDSPFLLVFFWDDNDDDYDESDDKSLFILIVCL